MIHTAKSLREAAEKNPIDIDLRNQIDKEVAVLMDAVNQLNNRGLLSMELAEAEPMPQTLERFKSWGFAISRNRPIGFTSRHTLTISWAKKKATEEDV
jgi:hypothetical protein